MYESSTKETKWVCIQLACSQRPRAFEEAHCWNIQPSSIMKIFHYYIKVTKQETPYYKDHGATLKHSYGKRIVALTLFISFLFFGPFFFLAFLFFWDNALLMMIITLLFIYNSMITTRY